MEKVMDSDTTRSRLNSDKVEEDNPKDQKNEKEQKKEVT